MIQLIEKGDYVLIETKNQTKILILEKKTFAWIAAADIGEILITSHKSHKVDHFLALGAYRMYKVENEKKYTDVLHLELFVGKGTWQGYLLPLGLPDDKEKRHRIIPTTETITKSMR